jgi:hypothetical protein
MQTIAPATSASLLARGQRMLYKFEIHDGAAWVDLCALGGKNYLKDDSLSVTPSGAGATPEVIAGTWSAEIHNPDGIFHPLNWSSAYREYFRVGRLVRISVGGVFDTGAKYFQRLIGYMDAPKFNHESCTVSLSGCDYAKRLADFELRSPTNHWGTPVTFSTPESTEVLGSEIYNEADAMDTDGEANNVSSWTTLVNATIASVADDEGGDIGSYNGEITKTAGFYFGTVADDNVGSVTVGKLYKVSFWHKRATLSFRAYIYADGAWNLTGQITGLTSGDWGPSAFYFTAVKSGTLRLTYRLDRTTVAVATARVDYISIKEVTSYTNTRYNMPDACNGPYYATLNGVALWYGDTNPPQGWLYDEANKILYFADGYYVAAGTNNLIVYYYTTQTVEGVVADILANGPNDLGGGVGLYANRAAALADMDYTATGATIDRVKFEGVSALEAIRMLCERVNYRFWFGYDGKPHFKPAPVAGTSAFNFTSFGHLGGLDIAQDLGQIRNRVVIEGIEQAMFAAREDKKTSRFTGTASDATSIATYLEHTESIKNWLFQDQATIDAMCATLLAERKTPKWFSGIALPHQAVPLEVGDTIQYDVSYIPGGTEYAHTAIIRGMSIEGGELRLSCELHLPELVVSDGAHALSSDNVALTQNHVLTVQDGTHAHAAENIALQQTWEYSSGSDGSYLTVPSWATQAVIECWGCGGEGAEGVVDENGGGGALLEEDARR